MNRRRFFDLACGSRRCRNENRLFDDLIRISFERCTFRVFSDVLANNHLKLGRILHAGGKLPVAVRISFCCLLQVASVVSTKRIQTHSNTFTNVYYTNSFTPFNYPYPSRVQQP